VSSNSSWSERKARLEINGVAVCFQCGRRLRSAMIRTCQKVKGGAPERDGEDRRKESGSGSPLVEESASDVCW
jgi:hypothetical protein